MSRRYSLLDLLRDEPRVRETLSYRDLTLCRRVNDAGRYNVGHNDERLCVLDVDDFDSEGALRARLDGLSNEVATEPAVIDPEPERQLVADGGGAVQAFDSGTLVDVAKELWPLGSLGTGLCGFVCVVVAASGVLPDGNFLLGMVSALCIFASTRLARAEGRRAYLEGER